MTERTDWFIGAEPVREGVYERMYVNVTNKVFYCLYKGGKWYCGMTTPEKAARITLPSLKQEMPWRGLSSQTHLT